MRRWLKIAGWVLGACLLLALIARGFSGWLTQYVRQRAMETLSARFASQVQFRSFSVTVFPRIKVSGQGLALRLKDRPGEPPLISVAKFSADAGMIELIRRPSHIHSIQLEGLQIRTPPRQDRPAGEQSVRRRNRHTALPVVVDVMLVKDAQLELLSSNTSKPPRVFVIHRLVMHDAGLGRPMVYHAWLTNPHPPGEIDARGQFGPWNQLEPRMTSLSGSYTFSHADLSTFRGIAGILSSQGKFQGILERIDVQGMTDTPDFTVELSGHPVDLSTQFHSIVDGTTGNTLLDPVRAQFLHTLLVARGGVVKTRGGKGRTVTLDVTADHARLGNLLRLAIKGNEPPIEGMADLETKMEIPPGQGDLADRLRLNGQFQIASARFTNPSVNQKVQALNRKGLGKRQDSEAANVLSNLKGHFVLRNAVITFSDLAFTVPGAAVRLQGTYKLYSENLNFQGTLRLKAELSQIVKGRKSVLLIPFDPFLRRGKAGTVLPIKVTGTAETPSFQLEVGRLLRHAYD